MKTPLIIVALSLFIILGFKSQLSAIHPVPLQIESSFVDGFALQNDPTEEDKKEKKLYRILTNSIWLMILALIVSWVLKLYCNVEIPTRENYCFKHGVGLSLFGIALLLLTRNKFTKRYERIQERKRKRRERKMREYEEYEEEEEEIIMF